MKTIPKLLIVLLLACCERQEKRPADRPEIVEDSPRTLEDLNLPEPKLDDFVLKITEGYEHLRPFLQQDIPPVIFEETLRDIRNDFDRKRIAADSKPGNWLNGCTIERRGVGLLSMFKEQEPPARVFIDYHSWKATQLEIGKPPVWDRINLLGSEYGRMFASGITVTAPKNGISDLNISFLLVITRQAEKEKAELEYKSGSHLYQLRGRYYLITYDPEYKGKSSSWLAHYDPEKVERREGVSRDLSSRILSRQVFCDSGFELSEEAKKCLLEIMDMIMVYYAKSPDQNVFRELLEKQPYQLVMQRAPW